MRAAVPEQERGRKGRGRGTGLGLGQSGTTAAGHGEPGGRAGSRRRAHLPENTASNSGGRITDHVRKVTPWPEQLNNEWFFVH